MSGKQKTIVWIIGLIVVFLIGLALIGSFEPVKSGGDQPSVRQSDDQFYKRTYIKGCMSEGGAQYRDYCECTWNELRSQYSIEELYEIQDNIAEDHTPQAIDEAAIACSGEIQEI